MRNAMRNLFRVLMVLWAGSLWSVTWVTWLLFHRLSDRHTAGTLAGPLFSIEAYLGVAVAVLALALPTRSRFAGVYTAAALLALSEWLLRPVMAAARAHGSAFGLGFGAWHGVSAILYAAACLAVLWTVWKQELR